MAKRFKMLAPFDSVSGNVSGAQKLAYPVNGQGAYEGPAGKNYAQNYKPRFIMNERKSDGRLYFQVKQRSATTITALSKRAMAVMGGCGAIVGAILKDKTSALYQALYEAWLVTKPFKTETGLPLTFRQYLSLSIMGALRTKAKTIMFLWTNEGEPDFITLKNPFVRGDEGTYDVKISDSALVKFWSELAQDPVVFEIEGIGTGVAHDGDDFSTLPSAPYNILGVEMDGEGVNAHAKVGSMYLKNDEGNYVIAQDDVQDQTYTLTHVTPA